MYLDDHSISPSQELYSTLGPKSDFDTSLQVFGNLPEHVLLGSQRPTKRPRGLSGITSTAFALGMNGINSTERRGTHGTRRRNLFPALGHTFSSSVERKQRTHFESYISPLITSLQKADINESQSQVAVGCINYIMSQDRQRSLPAIWWTESMSGLRQDFMLADVPLDILINCKPSMDMNFYRCILIFTSLRLLCGAIRVRIFSFILPWSLTNIHTRVGLYLEKKEVLCAAQKVRNLSTDQSSSVNMAIVVTLAAWGSLIAFDTCDNHDRIELISSVIEISDNLIMEPDSIDKFLTMVAIVCLACNEN